jgi:hypothetical protein
MIRRLSITFTALVLLGIGVAYAATNFSTFVSTRTGSTQPLGSSDWIPVYQGGTTTHIAGNLFLDTNSVQSVANKIFPVGSNTFSIRLGSGQDVTGTLTLGNGGLGLSVGNSGGVLCFNSASTLASSVTLAANTPLIGGGAGACIGAGSFTGNTTKSVSSTGAGSSGQGGSWDGSGNWIPNSNAVYANLPQTFTAHQIFTGGGRTKLRTQASTTDTLDTSTANTSDCGNKVLYTSTTTVTVTLPITGPAPCPIQLEQGSTGRIVLSNAGTPAFTSVHGFTGSFNGAGAVITVDIDTNVGGSAAHYVLTGDAQ